MIHFVPDSANEQVPAPYAEAIARLAGLRQALNLVEGMAGMASSPAPENRVAILEGESRRAWFEARSARAVAIASPAKTAVAAMTMPVATRTSSSAKPFVFIEGRSGKTGATARHHARRNELSRLAAGETSAARRGPHALHYGRLQSIAEF